MEGETSCKPVDVLHTPRRQVFAAEGGNRDRHVLNRLFSLGGRDDHLLDDRTGRFAGFARENCCGNAKYAQADQASQQFLNHLPLH